MEKVYDPKQIEDDLYQYWLKNDYFRSEVDFRSTPIFYRNSAAECQRFIACWSCS